MKFITFYVSLEGQIEDLKEFLVKKSIILELLQESLLLNKINTVNFEKNNNNKNSGKSNLAKLNLLRGYNRNYMLTLYNKLVIRREELAKGKFEANSFFSKSLFDKLLINDHAKFAELEASSKLEKLHFLSNEDKSNDIPKYSKYNLI